MSKWQYWEIYGKKYGIMDENRNRILDAKIINKNGEVDWYLDVNKKYEESILLVPEMIEWIETARELLTQAEFELNAMILDDNRHTRKPIDLVDKIRNYLRVVWRH